MKTFRFSRTVTFFFSRKKLCYPDDRQFAICAQEADDFSMFLPLPSFLTPTPFTEGGGGDPAKNITERFKIVKVDYIVFT